MDWDLSLWVPILGIVIALIPTILLIYVLMCMIASRKPGGKVVLVIFILWILTIIACATIAIKENVGERLRERNNVLKEVLHRQITIDDNTTTLEKLLEEYDDESIIREGRNSVHIEVPSQALDITVDKNEGAMQITSDGRKIFSLRAKTGEQGDSDSLTLKATAPATDNDAE